MKHVIQKTTVSMEQWVLLILGICEFSILPSATHSITLYNI